jgi:hypothetical protein
MLSHLCGVGMGGCVKGSRGVACQGWQWPAVAAACSGGVGVGPGTNMCWAGRALHVLTGGCQQQPPQEERLQGHGSLHCSSNCWWARVGWEVWLVVIQPSLQVSLCLCAGGGALQQQRVCASILPAACTKAVVADTAALRPSCCSIQQQREWQRVESCQVVAQARAPKDACTEQQQGKEGACTVLLWHLLIVQGSAGWIWSGSPASCSLVLISLMRAQ